MTAPGVPPAGAVALRDRALAPDVARGAMLLLIALANVHLYLFDRPLGVRSYPAAPAGLDAVVTGVQLVLVDGRAYPLFGLLFGYGLGQLAARRAAAGAEPGAVVRLVHRRGWWLVTIGVGHVVLLWSGDIVAAYGVLAVALGAMVVSGTAVSLATTAVVGSVLGTGLGAFSAFSPPGTAPLPSVAVADPVAAAVERVSEWAGGIVIGSLISVVGAVALGALAARYRVLDEPAAHRRLLGRVAAAGLDVFAKEPCTDSPLFAFDNVVAVPHLGASTAEAQDKAGLAVAKSVKLALQGEFVPDAVNVQVGGIVDEERVVTGTGAEPVVEVERQVVGRERLLDPPSVTEFERCAGLGR